MQYHIYATLSDGRMVFNGTLNYVPRINEEVEANGHVFVVQKVRYVLKEGTTYANFVELRLKEV